MTANVSHSPDVVVCRDLATIVELRRIGGVNAPVLGSRDPVQFTVSWAVELTSDHTMTSLLNKKVVLSQR